MTERIEIGKHITQQWLTEIESLKQQLVEQQRDRDAAWESAEKWRKLYNTEAEQRRTDADLTRKTIASLQTEIQKLKGIDGGTFPNSTVITAIHQELAAIKTVEDLKTKLVAVIQERDRLIHALKIEQENHTQTRKSLTTALGDAIDSLAKERAG
jgi:membrane-associated HD superfamily phosphohydrolase